MKYVILQYFFLVHFCNIKISVNSSRDGSKGLNDEIDSYTNQETNAARNESDTRNKNERIQETGENQSNNDKVSNKNKHVNIKKEFSDKIDVQAVMNDSLSEKLKLNYEYLTQKALEKNGRSNSETVAKSDVEDQSKESNNIEESENKDLDRKMKGHAKHEATKKIKRHSKKKTINENKRSRDNDRKKDHNRHSKTSHNDHINIGDERHEKSKEKYHLLEEEGYEDTVHSRESQNQEPKVKTTVNQEQEESHIKQEIIETEETLSSIGKENHKPSLSEEKKIELLSLSEEFNTEDENVDSQIRNKNGNQKNIITLDDNPYGGVKTIRFENSDDDQKSQKRSTEVQITKKQENEGPNNPVIRKEGGKLYTYVKSPDYDDYHEELTEWRKTHPEKNPADFI